MSDGQIFIGPEGEIHRINSRAAQMLGLNTRMVAGRLLEDVITPPALLLSALRQRRDALVTALGAHIPEARFVVPEGGYFLWVELPEGLVVLGQLASGYGVDDVRVARGADFDNTGELKGKGERVHLSRADAEALATGLGETSYDVRSPVSGAAGLSCRSLMVSSPGRSLRCLLGHKKTLRAGGWPRSRRTS